MRRAALLILGGSVVVAGFCLFLSLAPTLGLSRRLVAVLVVGLLLNVCLYLALRFEPVLSPEVRRALARIKFPVLVVITYFLVLWLATMLEPGMASLAKAAWFALPFVLVVIAYIARLVDRHRGLRQRSIDPARLLVFALAAEAAMWQAPTFEWAAGRVFGSIGGGAFLGVTVVTLAISALVVVWSRRDAGSPAA